MNKKQLAKMIKPLNWRKDVAICKTFGRFEMIYGFTWHGVILNGDQLIYKAGEHIDVKKIC